MDGSDVHPRFQTQFNFVSPTRAEVETISNWTSSPAEVYHSEIAPLGMESAAIINLESKRTIDLWGKNVMPFHTFSVLSGFLVAIPGRQKHWTCNNQSYPVIISVILRGVLNLIRFSGWSGATAISRSSTRRWSTIRTREMDICMNNSLSYLPFFFFTGTVLAEKTFQLLKIDY